MFTHYTLEKNTSLCTHQLFVHKYIQQPWWRHLRVNEEEE